ncbi:MAG: hypothetical protein SGCHY_004744 [Lobulomycetales sp.]
MAVKGVPLSMFFLLLTLAFLCYCNLSCATVQFQPHGFPGTCNVVPLLEKDFLVECSRAAPAERLLSPESSGPARKRQRREASVCAFFENFERLPATKESLFYVDNVKGKGEDSQDCPSFRILLLDHIEPLLRSWNPNGTILELCDASDYNLFRDAGDAEPSVRVSSRIWNAFFSPWHIPDSYYTQLGFRVCEKDQKPVGAEAQARIALLELTIAEFLDEAAGVENYGLCPSIDEMTLAILDEDFSGEDNFLVMVNNLYGGGGDVQSRSLLVKIMHVVNMLAQLNGSVFEFLAITPFMEKRI